MDNREEIRDFLSSRRARITPEQAGLPVYGGNRRVPGLRREEVALLAGVSVDYYTRLERGNLGGASDEVLEAIARALELNEDEHIHLFDLARAAGRGSTRATRLGAAAGSRAGAAGAGGGTGPGARRPRQAARQPVRAGLRAVLDSMTAPAVIRNGRLDVLAANEAGRALYAPLLDSPSGPPNHARFAFLDARSREFWADWERASNDTVGILRIAAGHDPYDRALSDLVGELSTRSQEFRTRWAAHDVHLHRSGRKTINHPVVGRLELSFETLLLPADDGLTMLVYTAADPATADALTLLASWAATTEAATSESEKAGSEAE